MHIFCGNFPKYMQVVDGVSMCVARYTLAINFQFQELELEEMGKKPNVTQVAEKRTTACD
jgi:hypothetical protein